MIRRLFSLLDPFLLLLLVAREVWRSRRHGTAPATLAGHIILSIVKFVPDGTALTADQLDVQTLKGVFQRVLSLSLSDSRQTIQRSEPAPGIHYMDVPLHPANGLARRGLRRSAALAGLSQVRQELETAIAAGRYGTVTAHDPHLLGLLGVAIACRTGVPLILHLNSNFDNKFAQTGKVSFPWAHWRWMERRIEHFVMARASVIVADRHYYRTSGFVPARYHHKYRTVGVFPPLVVNAERGPSRVELLKRWSLPDRPVLVYVGRLHPHKLAEDLIPFALQLAKSGSDWTFVLAGDGPLRGAMEAAAMPLGDRIRFLGNQTPDAVADLFRLAHFVVATHGGVTLVEAATAAKATLAYDYDWMPEFITDGTNGALVTVRDVTALAAVAAGWLAQPEIPARLGRAARETVQRHYQRGSALRHEGDVYRALQPSPPSP
ncbi:MAG: glycosyltransferase family 4 protein [Candidatus Sericytochromatia bacterium]|nr:glycosyltransferase family 4 protein [Candidatus Sericytochromatia bacterium]